MDKEERKKLEADVERKAYETFPLWKRSHWDEWGSPVGLSLGWALFIIPIGIFLWLLHLAGLIG